MTVAGSDIWPLDAVFFDFDGVILESVEVKRAGFRLLFSRHGPEVQEAASQFDVANHGLSRFDKFRWCCDELLQVEPTDQVMAELDRQFSAAILERVLTVDFVPGAVEFLQRWSERLACFVVSAAPQVEIAYVVNQRGLAQHFVSVHGSPVTKAEWLKRLLGAHGLQPNRTVMVGDSVSDAAAALEHGVPFVARQRPGTAEPFDLDRCRAAIPDLVDLDEVLGLDTGTG